jgi:Glutaminase
MNIFFSKPFLRLRTMIVLPAACLLLVLAACNGGDQKDKDKPGDKPKDNTEKPADDKGAQKPEMDSSILTIAAVRNTPDGSGTEVLFNERAEIYVIAKGSANYKANADMINAAVSRNTPEANTVVKLFANRGSNSISNIVMATEAEAGQYRKMNVMEKSLAKPVAVDVSRIDTAKFNRVENLRAFAPVFKLCTSLVPDYATLVSMFNYCVSQGCNKPGPYIIPNCIPFQYVRDGCYARAHKMRQMIQQKYGYCCEKVFSFANSGNATLAVKADKWGGCCVNWWYHVVPLFRVNMKVAGFTYQVCYVLDPGMFNQPVTLSTWLQAQKNTTCSPNANVSMYSIQPGSAYAPSNYAGTTFSTDPNYVQTEQTLIAYKNLKTCN